MKLHGAFLAESIPPSYFYYYHYFPLLPTTTTTPSYFYYYHYFPLPFPLFPELLLTGGIHSSARSCSKT